MANPLSDKTRSVLYVIGIAVGALSVVLGPLSLALNIGEDWTAVLVSAVGAVTSLTNLLARSNLPEPREEELTVDGVQDDVL